MGPRQNTRAGRSTQTLREAILSLRLVPGTRASSSAKWSIGSELTLQPAAASEWYARVVSGATNLTPTPWTQRADPDGLLYILFHSKGFANTMKYRNEQVDALLEQARTIYDMPRRKQLYGEAQRQILADLPMVPLLFGAEYAALRASVNGFEWIPDQIPRFHDLWMSG